MKFLETICNSIDRMINLARAPLAYVPAALLVCGAIKRPGLSAMLIAANIIRRQSEAGAPVGNARDGKPSVAEAMERIRVEELVKALKMDAQVQIGLPIGGISISATGGNAGGPIEVIGFNTNNPHGVGIVQ